MAEYYFCYGSEGQDYSGGWTVVEAEDLETAVSIFCIFHPRKTENGCIPCGGIYDEETMKNTSMWQKGNFGKREVERITVKREVKDGRV